MVIFNSYVNLPEGMLASLWKTDADDLEWRTKSQDFREGSADLSFEHLIHMLQPDTMGLIRPSTSAKRNTNPETRQLTNIICARISISIAGIYWAYRKVCAELFVRALVIPCVNLCLYGFPLADASWPTAAESTPSKQLPRRGHPGKSAVLQQPITLALKWKRPYKIL